MAGSYFAISLALALLALACATTPSAENPAALTTESPKIFGGYDLDELILFQQLFDSGRRFVCAAEGDTDKGFVTPSPCKFHDTNITEETCKLRGCCYSVNEESLIATCTKPQENDYVLAMLDEMVEELPGNSNKKQGININDIVACITTGRTDCADLSTLLAQLQTTIVAALAGNDSATQIFLANNGAILTLVVDFNLITNDQLTSLLALPAFESIAPLFSGRIVTIGQPPPFPLPTFTQAPPPPPPVTQPLSIRGCFWFPWGGWSRCEGICGAGVQTRIRRCNGCAPGTGNCQGACNIYRACASPIGMICGYWSGWGSWGSCSASCGAGQYIRTRTCIGGQVGSPGCEGVTSQSQVCNAGDGFYRQWGAWSVCPASCGGSIQTRVRQHTCKNDESQGRNCATVRCCGKQPWSAWSGCSVTCFAGSRSRSRSDICTDLPNEVQTEACNAGAGNYGPWTPWGACSLTCPGGTQTRERMHSCRQKEVQGRACGLVGDFAEWSRFGPCSATCPGGVTARTRAHSCTNSIQRDVETCGPEGDYGDWASWGPCSNTCNGARTRSRFHSCNKNPDTETEQCGTGGFYGDWLSWGPCSQSCAGGIRSRTQIQVCTAERRSESQACGASGSWGVYSSWSTCTKPCGVGERFRSRLHSCPNTLPTGEQSVQRVSEACNTQICCVYQDWAQWSSCPVSCGWSTAQRRRANTCTQVDPQIQRQYCYGGSGAWQAWNAWSVCSSTCPGGRKSRSRSHSCSGNNQNQVALCGEQGGYGEWSNWSTCDKSCGGGFQTRFRAPLCPRLRKNEIVTQSCNTDPGAYLPPDNWSACSSSCPGGTRTRVTRHTCNLPTKVESEGCGGPGQFLPFGQWSSCSSTCTGVRRRMQRHQCQINPNVEEESCGTGGSYGPWGSWGECSQLCAGGERSRFRFHNCGASPDRETVACGREPFYRQWTLWGACSRTCGTGEQKRNRLGLCGNGPDEAERKCATDICCDIQPWQEWTSCSATCFSGQRRRVRYSLCSLNTPVDTQVETCTAPRELISDWTVWAPCSRSCGGGLRSRSRTSNCRVLPDETQTCGGNLCPIWTSWDPWSSCTATCFAGTITRTRRCINGQRGDIGCVGDSGESANCNLGNGQWTGWSLWTMCSATCAGGTRTRTRGHTCGITPEFESEACNTFPGAYGPWSVWSQCSQTCVGVYSRRRVHTCIGNVDEETATCNVNAGQWTLWGSWTSCSRTCGGGSYSRTRRHTCTDEVEVQDGQCNTFLGDYTPWSVWSACSATCGNGARGRSRQHSCGLQDDDDISASSVSLKNNTTTELTSSNANTCNTQVCPYWSGWTEWSGCSTTCGQGGQTRSRICQAGNNGQIGCLGDFFQQRFCEAGNGTFGPWTPFGRCSKTCNSGLQSRRRVNPCLELPEVQTVPCNTQPGEWAAWQSWGTCPVVCGGGTVSRRRSHTCGLKDQIQVAPCNTDPGNWSAWGQWGTCSASCGGGTSTRSRRHSCTGQVETQTSICNTQPCAIWGGWSNWGACSKSCNGGVEERDRLCFGGDPGTGLCFISTLSTTDTRPCNTGPCCAFEWSGWSVCCDSPSYQDPIQLRFRGDTCSGIWQNFTRMCPVGVRRTGFSCLQLGEIFETADIFREERRRKRSIEVPPPM